MKTSTAQLALEVLNALLPTLEGDEYKNAKEAIAAIEANLTAKAEPVGLRDAVLAVCEGWTLPDGARKVLESALYAAPQQAEAPKSFENLYAEAPGWISVGERLPADATQALVYRPPMNGEPERIDFEYFEDECWVMHADHYEHFMIVGGVNAAGPDCECTGPSESAPYTHWMPLPAAPGSAA